MQTPTQTLLPLLLLLAPLTTAAKPKPKDAILLSQVKSLTFSSHRQTTHRRVPSIPQLKVRPPSPSPNLPFPLHTFLVPMPTNQPPPSSRTKLIPPTTVHLPPPHLRPPPPPNPPMPQHRLLLLPRRHHLVVHRVLPPDDPPPRLDRRNLRRLRLPRRSVRAARQLRGGVPACAERGGGEGVS